LKSNYTIKIPENFTVNEVVEFRARVNELIKNGTINFIFDFIECKFIDSTGLGALVSIYKKCVEREGSIKLKHLNSNIEKLFKLTRLDKVFEIDNI